MNYESETEDGSTGLDDVVWPKVFEKYEQFLKDVRVQPGDDRLELNPIAKPFYARQTAMIRTTAGIADVMPDQYGFNASILPYFGETANDSWLLTYPMCQAAVSNTVAQDEAKLAAVLKVLEAVYSAEGQSKMRAVLPCSLITRRSILPPPLLWNTLRISSAQIICICVWPPPRCSAFRKT